MTQLNQLFLACNHGLAVWGERPNQFFKEQFVFDAVGKVAKDAVSFQGRREDVAQRRKRVQILDKKA